MAPFSICGGNSSKDVVVASTNSVDGQQSDNVVPESIVSNVICASSGLSAWPCKVINKYILTTKRLHMLANETIVLTDQTISDEILFENLTNELQRVLLMDDNDDNKNVDTSSIDRSANVVQTNIKEFVSGNKQKEVKQIGNHMDQTALKCIKKSLLMIDTLKDSTKSTPGWIEQYAKTQQQQDSSSSNNNNLERSSEDPKDSAILQTIEQDIKDIEECVQTLDSDDNTSSSTTTRTTTTTTRSGIIENDIMNIEKHSFDVITSKTKNVRTIFEYIREFCIKIVNITENIFQNGISIKDIIDKTKDMIELIGLSNKIKYFATKGETLIKSLVGLYDKASDKIKKLFYFIDNIKDRIELFINDIQDSSVLLQIVKKRTIELKQQSKDIQRTLAQLNDSSSNSSTTSSKNNNNDNIERMKYQYNVIGTILSTTTSKKDSSSNSSSSIQNAIDITKVIDQTLLKSSNKTKQIISKIKDSGAVVESLTSSGNNNNNIDRSIASYSENHNMEQHDKILQELENGISNIKKSTDNIIIMNNNNNTNVGNVVVENNTNNDDDAVVMSSTSTTDAIQNVNDNINLVQNETNIIKTFFDSIKKVLNSLVGGGDGALSNVIQQVQDFINIITSGNFIVQVITYIQNLFMAIKIFFISIKEQLVEWFNTLEDKLTELGVPVSGFYTTGMDANYTVPTMERSMLSGIAADTSPTSSIEHMLDKTNNVVGSFFDTLMPKGSMMSCTNPQIDDEPITMTFAAAASTPE